MKNIILFSSLLISSFNSCYSQNSECPIDSISINKIRAEIIGENMIIEFADTVLFDFGKEKGFENQQEEINSKWEKVKCKFRDTDFIIKLKKEAACSIEIKNHKECYVLEFNDKGQVTAIKNIELNLPRNSPDEY